jgi:hypothetical protein
MERAPDSRAVNIVLLLASMPVVIATLLSGRAFGGGPTLCLAFSALGLHGLLSDPGDSTQLPRARVRRRKR